MKIEGIPFEVTDWGKLSSFGMDGLTGRTTSKEIDRGDIRLRLVEYSAHYESDHWCTKGHLVWVLEGDLTLELEGGKKFPLRENMSLQVGDNVVPHKVFSGGGARVIIID